MQYTRKSVYTIVKSQSLKEMYDSGRSGTFTEKKPWVTAHKLWKTARSSDEVVPVIFAFAKKTSALEFFADLYEVTMRQNAEGKWTTEVAIKNLTKISAPRPLKTRLTVSSTRERLSAGFIRPYAIVDTPSFLLKLSEK